MIKCIQHTLTSLLCFYLCSCASSLNQSNSIKFDLPKSWGSQNVEYISESDLSNYNKEWIIYFEQNPILQKLISETILNNQDILILTSRVSRAHIELNSINSNRLPTINANFDGNRQQISTFGPTPIINKPTYDSHTASLGLRWEIDVWGKLKSQSESSLAIAESNAANLRYAQMSIASQIVKTWLSIMHCKGQKKLISEQIVLLNKILLSTEERYIRGLVNQEILMDEKNRLEEAEKYYFLISNQHDELVRSIYFLSGTYPCFESIEYSPLPEMKCPIPAGIPSDILKNRPDIIAAEKQLISSRKILESTKKELFPSFSLTGKTGFASNDLSSLLNNNSSVWGLGISLSQPLINFGKTKYRIKSSKEKSVEDKSYYEKIVLNALKEVENGLSNERYYMEIKASQKSILDNSKSIANIHESNYYSGNLDSLIYDKSKLGLIQSEIDHLKILHDQLQNRINLHLALGYSFIDNN